MGHNLQSIDEYEALYQQSITAPEIFWGTQADQLLSWHKPWKSVLSGSLETHDVKWFEGAELNASVNCLDRHLAEKANQVAIYWEGNEPNEFSQLTYQQLYEQVCQLSNALVDRGVTKGERVCIYMPMIPEAIISMLACARISAVHSVVFGGFSPEALRNRISDADCSVVITANVSRRGDKQIRLKEKLDVALANSMDVHTVLVVRRDDVTTPWIEDRDFWFHELIHQYKPSHKPHMMKANDPLFILYTSGSTGKPKGVQHALAGYLLFATMTFQTTFNFEPNDIFWCTADIGWITGHTYIVYGPLASGASIVLYEGIPTYPSTSRYWDIIDKYHVTTFYTSPTAIRSLMREGDEALKLSDRKSLKVLGTVGEPINPKAWEWYYDKVGHKRCPIVDTWWQTETGGIMISPLPTITPLKPGSAAWPFYGVKPNLLDKQGKVISGVGEGNLVISAPWPGMMQTLYNDKERYIKHYFSTYPGNYLTGDSAKRDEEGYYWITGRTDDVINVSGHRICTAEIESALVKHPEITEAAVVGAPHDIKGQCVYAFVTPQKDVIPDEQLIKSLKTIVRNTIGPFATPETIRFTAALPKTRSGKIMRRILRKIAGEQLQELGDISTLSNPECINDLIDQLKKMD